MTEAEWLTCADPSPMLDFLWRKAGDRKLLLFASNCCRRAWEDLRAPSKLAVEAVERAADTSVCAKLRTGAMNFWFPDAPLGSESLDELHRFQSEADEIANPLGDHCPSNAVLSLTNAILAHTPAALLVSVGAAAAQIVEWRRIGGIVKKGSSTPGWCNGDHDASVVTACLAAGQMAAAEEGAAEAAMLVDIFGSLFRSVTLDRAAISSAVAALAQTIYNERTFDRMPELANALEAAGEQNGEILSHCRGPGPHVRGCWAVDLLLGKT